MTRVAVLPNDCGFMAIGIVSHYSLPVPLIPFFCSRVEEKRLREEVQNSREKAKQGGTQEIKAWKSRIREKRSDRFTQPLGVEK